MEIIVFARRFENGNWGMWEHTCSEEEVDAVKDSAQARAYARFSLASPVLIDYLAGARYIFDAAFGPLDRPRDGDTRVHGVCVDGIVVGISDELRRPAAVAEKVA
jgi:hypothetical protein